VPAQREQWLARALGPVRTTSPRHLIYLKALYGVGFVGGDAPFMVVDQRESLPFVVVNEGDLDTMGPDGPKRLLAAAVYGVNVALVPPTIVPDLQTYKGFTIHTSTTEDGKRFFVEMKSAIDMIGQLPPDLAALARAVTDLRYEPRQPFDPRGGAVTLMLFTRDAKTGKGYLSFAENYDARGPGRMVDALVGGGVLARRPASYKPDPVRGDCEVDRYELKTQEALGVSVREKDRAYKRLAQRGCP
jgi:hypothetical protein